VLSESELLRLPVVRLPDVQAVRLRKVVAVDSIPLDMDGPDDFRLQQRWYRTERKAVMVVCAQRT
jgi:hypothetical protein